jgi:hypothetical protein
VGEDRLCGDYENRPRACRDFYCKLARAYEDGRVNKEEATRLAARARILAERLAEHPDMRGDPETLLDFAELRTIVRRHFYEGDGR